MKKRTLGVGALLVTFGILGMSLGTVSAYKGDLSVKGPNYSVERHDAMTKAFASKDYEAWKKLMDGKGRVSQVVTKENFAKFTEIHTLVEQGKTSEAQKLRQELGLGLQNGMGKNLGKGMGKGIHR